MKAIVFPSVQAISVEKVADPTPQPDEVVVQVAMAGIYGTDLHIYHNEYMFDATGVPQVIEGGFNYLRPRGHFLLFGVDPMQAKITISPYEIFRHDWPIMGSFALCYTFPQGMRWLETGVGTVDAVVSHTAPLDEFPTLFQQFAAGQTLKVHLNNG